MQEEKQKLLDQTIKQIEKEFGKGAVMKFSDTANTDGMDVIPTGSLGLDIALGVGGIPRGRIVEIYGPESSGKTTLTLHIVAEAQKLGGTAVFIDVEHSLDPVYAKKLGVNIDELYISQPDDGEQALDIVESMIRSNAVDIIVVDSVAALVPRAEIEGEMGSSHMGLQARLMSQALRKITAIANKSGTIVIFTNQLREKIGVMFGNPETTTGGRALKFYASMRLDIRRIESIKDGQEFIANRTRVRVAKNKVAPPHKQCEFDIVYGEGISKEGDILDYGVEMEAVTRAGAWYSYGEVRLGQGRENAKTFLKENPEIYDEIEEKIRVHYGLLEGDEKEEVKDEKDKEKEKDKDKKEEVKNKDEKNKDEKDKDEKEKEKSK